MTIPYLELYKEADGKVRILNRPWWRFIIPGRLLICEGFQIPRGYGIAYWDVICDDTVCYPLGINVIVAVLRKLHRFVKMPRFFITDQRDEWLLQAQLKAKELGRTVGYQSGYDRAWRQALCGVRPLTPQQRDILIGLITAMSAVDRKLALNRTWLDELRVHEVSP